MSHCKHRVMDRCKKHDIPCTFSEECFEPEVEPAKTNADRIRSMSDEELAKWFISVGICIRDLDDVRCDGVSCKECRLNWLRHPAEEG